MERKEEGGGREGEGGRGRKREGNGDGEGEGEVQGIMCSLITATQEYHDSKYIHSHPLTQ